MKLLYSELARNDIDEIYNYIYENNTIAARKFVDGLKITIERLREFPELGTISKLPELAMKRIRMFPYGNYLILYRIDYETEIVYIYHVFHGARNYKYLF